MNIRSILVPLDGSAYAEAALPQAVGVARRTGARLRLVLVHEARWFAGAGDRGAALAVEALERARTYLDATARDLAGQGLVVDAGVLEGLPGPTLAGSLVRHADNLVVMATHGRGPLNRLWLGSVADYLVRHLEVPVLLVRPAEAGAAPASGLARVLVALDGSARSERILEAVPAVAGPEARLTLVTVVQPVIGIAQPAVPFPVPMIPELAEELAQSARSRLDRVVERLAPRGVTAEARVLSGTAVASALLEAATAGDHDLMALTTRGEGGVQRALLGSVADKVIRGATLPVLVWAAEGE